MSLVRTCAFVVVALGLAGCGGSSSKASSQDDAAQATTAILLRAADLPTGFTGANYDSTDDNDTTNKDFARCVAASPPDAGSVRDTYSQHATKGSRRCPRRSPPTSTWWPARTPQRRTRPADR